MNHSVCIRIAASIFALVLAPCGFAQRTIAITELVAVRNSGIQDDDKELNDWLEISNFGIETQQLDGCYLTDDPKKLDKWKLPATELAPGESVLVMASGKDQAKSGAPLHANFSLNEGGEFLALVEKDGEAIIHAYAPKFPPQKPNASYGVVIDTDARSDGRPRLTESFFLEPTPGEPNSARMMGDLGPVVFGQQRGLYDQPFDLELSTSTPGAQIRYTTNGSRPTSDTGNVYSQPIPVNKSTVIRSAAFKTGFRSAAVATHSYILPEAVLNQSPSGLPPEGFPYDWGRNRVNYGMDPEVTKDPERKRQILESFGTLPTFSLVTEMEHLFDEETGIYARSQEDGRDWERPASVELINPDKSDGFQIDCGLRIRGGFSRMPQNPKHAFRLFFRKEYGESKLKYPLFGDNGTKEFDNLDLRTFQNYSWSLAGDPRGIFLRDQFSRDLLLETGQPGARGEYCHLYVNGHYWGLYNTCERPKAAFAASYLEGKKKEFDIVKQGRDESGLAFMATDGNLDAWRQQWDLAKDLSSNDAYFKLMGCNPDGTRNESYSVLLNPENLIDYMLIIFYAGNFDSPVTKFAGNRYPNNWYGIRNREGTEGFRYFVWDAEHTLLDVNEDRTGPFPAGMDYGSSNPQWIYQQCLDNAEFRMLAADRIHKHFFNDGALTPQAVASLFRRRAAEIETAVVCESARWGDSTFGGYAFNSSPPPTRRDENGQPIYGPLGERDWEKEINRILNEYIPHRSEIVLGQLYQHGIVPDVDPPKIERTPDSLVIENALKKGDIYYTTNGDDPRSIGGKVASGAKKYTSTVTKVSGIIKARVKVGDDWSAISIAGE